MHEHESTTFDPDGRLVVFDGRTWLHLKLGRPLLADEVELVLGVVARPDHREHDPHAGRERYYRRDLDQRRWLRVVVDFNELPARVVTALIQHNTPPTWNR